MKIGRSTLPGLFLACIFAFCSVTYAWAQFSGGSGSPESPYQIATAQDLHNVRNYPAAHYIQSTDIDLNIAPFNQGLGWQAIGSLTAPFTGSFDGAAFNIDGLFINRPAVQYIALFGHTQFATFSNIHLLNCDISGGDYTAALAASAKNTEFLDCGVSGSITGAGYTGALVGSLELNSSIQNCSGTALVSGSFATGGLCGYAKGSAQISSSVSRGTVTGINTVGGLLGILADAHLYDSYSAASVTGTRYVGGLLGTNDLQGLVEGCYARGPVSGNSNSGGLIGRSVLGSCLSSYWDTITSGQSSSAGGEGRSSEQMLPPYDVTTYVNWDFAIIWHAHQSYNGGYPYLNWEYTVPSNVALLVYDKNNLNAYDTGFINVLNTIITDYDTIDIAEISSGQSVLSNHRVVISNFMGYGTAAPTAFNSIASQLEAATQAGTEFIVGSESVALPVALGLVNGTMNGSWGPGLNDTRAITEIAIDDAISQGVNVIPNYQSYLGQDGSVLSSYFGTGVFWKVISSFGGNFYTYGSYIQYPVHKFNTIWNSWTVTNYHYPAGPKVYNHNNSRILHLMRFWTQNNVTRSKGWIGPEGIQILDNAIDHYLNTDYVATPPSELSEVFISSNGSQHTLHWNAVADVDYYEIWQSSDGQNWNPIGLQSEDGSGSYAWLSPLSTDNDYRVRPIWGDTPGAFVEATIALAAISVSPSALSLSIVSGSGATENLEISNPGLGTLEWTSLLTEVSPGLSVVLSPAQGTIASGDTLVCELSIETGSAEPGLYEFTLQLDSNDPDQPRISLPISVEVSSPLAYIPDDNFRMAINRELEQPTAYQPTIADLESIIFVEATGEGIVNLEGAQHLINMQGLYLDSNQISELSPISNLTHLQSLDLNYNQISDLSPLSNLTLLEILYMTDNQISDLSPLSNMTLLRSLYLNNNQITELSPLSNMTLLERLYLYDNQITELSPVSSLANLQRLYLTNNQVSDLSPISSLTNLQGLTLSSNQISELSPLAGLSNLQWLTLAGNQINDIGPLSSLISLQDLDLSANQISDIWPLSGLINLNEFYLEANPLSYESMLLSQNWNLPYIASSYEPIAPCYPAPERSAMEVDPSTALSWQANYSFSSTALYEVYLGASPDSLSYSGEGTLVDSTTYSFATNFDTFTQYWWKIKAVYDTTAVWSGLWSFTTGEEIQQFPEISLSPTEFYESLFEGESAVQFLNIDNTGDAILEYDISSEAAYRIQETEYAAPDRSQLVSNFTNHSTSNRSSNRKVVKHNDRDYSGLNVLVMEEIADDTYYADVLEDLGISHTYVNSWSGLYTELSSATSWDLIIVNSYEDVPDVTLLDALLTYLNNGGKLIFADWALGVHYSHTLIQALGINYISYFEQPKPFTAINASHPVFSAPNSIQALQVTSDQANIDGQVVSIIPGATALANFSVDPYSSAIVLGATGNSIFNAFQTDNFKGDNDLDGKLDILELIENQIIYLLGDYQPWLSFNPSYGTIEPGSSHSIELAFNAENLIAGAYTCNLIVSSNDPSYPEVMVPASLQVMALQEALIAVYPDYIDYSLVQDSTDQVELHISNSGSAELAWSATIVDLNRRDETAAAPRPRVSMEMRTERKQYAEDKHHLLPEPPELSRTTQNLRARDMLLALNPQAAFVQADSTMFCYLNIDSSGSLSGSYEYQIVISSNAVNEPELIIPVSITVTGTPAYIPDDNFRMAINAALGQGAEYQPTIADLESLSVLDANRFGIYSIEGAQYLINLQYLYLGVNQISNISPLSGLTNLQELNLGYNQISELSPLSYLYNLQELYLGVNQISDISPLAGLISLQMLDLSNNQISDISPLSGLTNLQGLYLFNNQISDISPLSYLYNLQYLYLGGNQISELSPLSELTNLQWLYLDGNQISDLSPLINLTNMESLSLENNPLSYESMLLSQNWNLPYIASSYEPIAPCYPAPERSAMEVDPSTALSWQANYSFSSTALYEVYLGASPDFLSYSGEGTLVDSTTYSFATNFDTFTEYYWKIKAIYDTTTVWSGLWSFTTGETILLAEIGVEPAFIYEELNLEESSELQITITNTGNTPLNWDSEIISMRANRAAQDRTLSISLEPAAGTIEAASYVTCLLSFSPADTLGTYSYEIRIASNDPENPLLIVPVDYQVLSPLAYIPDDNFRMAINRELEQPTAYQPTIADLESLSGTLSAGASEIVSLEGAQHLINLQTISLHNNEISDISPLAGLISLQELGLYDNQISDISQLSSLINLQELYLHDNLISDLSPLSSMSNLINLFLYNNQINDISPLSSMANLQLLYIEDNQISDLGPLNSMPYIRRLYLDNNQISDLDPLSNLSNLEWLKLHNNQISDISPLANMTNLQYLFLDDNPLSYESMLLSQSWSLPYTTSTYEPIAPCYPDPERNAMEVDPSSELSWQANYAFTQAAYQVYLGEDPQSLSYIGNGYNVDGTAYAFETLLQPFTQYWWKVKAIYDTTAVWSGLWSFSTGEEIIPEEAIIAVTPEYIDHSLVQDSTDQVELHISNSGSAELAWSATIVDLNRRDETAAAPRPRVSMEMRPERKQYAEDKHHLLPEPPELSRTTQNLRARDMLLALNPQAAFVQADSSMFCYLNIDSSGSLSGYYEYQIVISSNAVNEPELIIPVSITVTGTPAYIPDDNFRMAINAALGQGADYQPTIADLESLSVLDADRFGIYSIEGAQHLINLQYLYLGYNQISNISPLANLTNLQELYLFNNQISDLSPLAGLTNLQELYLQNNQISDISPLAGLISLQELYLDNNQISELSPLSGLISLQGLYLFNNQISDLSPLAGLISLQGLYLGNNQISDISPLAGLTNLYDLYLGYNQISDISPLANLTNLQWLYLYDNQISDLSPLTNLTNLQYLFLDDNPLSYESMLLTQDWSLPYIASSYEPIAPCYPDPERNAMEVDPSSELSWQANYAFTQAAYQVYLGSDPQSLSYIGNGYNVDGTAYAFETLLQPFTQYYWKIKAIYDTTAVWSGLWSFTTGEELQPLLPPENVLAEYGDDDSYAQLSWQPPLAGTPESYQVWRLIPGEEDSESMWTLVAPAVMDTIHFDTEWQSLPEGTYKWAVKASYVGGNLSAAAFSNGLYKELFEATIYVSPYTIYGNPIAGTVYSTELMIQNNGLAPLIWQAELIESVRISQVNPPPALATSIRIETKPKAVATREISYEYYPTAGTIEASNYETIYLEFYSSESSISQSYTYNLEISSNATNSPLVVVPITIEVLPSTTTNNAPIVSNVRATQRDDDSMQIDIYYDVFDSDGDALTISMEVSADDGVTWVLSCLEILPDSDIGAGILSGTDKHIVWDAAVEHPNLLFGNNFRFRINADDGVGDLPEGFVLVEGGNFHNGTSDVTVSSFYMDKYELTQAEYQAVMGTNPASGYGVGSNYPVYYVSWFNAIEYSNRRSMAEGFTPCYSYSTYGTNPDDWPTGWNSYTNHSNVSCSWTANGYRLPTEAEWQFAARGGNQSHNYTYSGSNDINAVAWYGSNSGDTTHTVGTKTANELGIYDLSGNVWEWTWDIYGEYPSNSQTNPTGANSGSLRVWRGGSWGDGAHYCTVSNRYSNPATNSYDTLGFRVCRSIHIELCANPSFTPSAGSYTSSQSVEIQTATTGASIRYTTDGSEPSASYGLVYTSPINVSASTIIKAIAYKDGYLDSEVVTAEYTITALPPDDFVFVAGGTFHNGTSNVTLSSFYMDKYELTQAEYQAVMGTNPASGFGVGSNYPVYYVSWFNAIEYSNRRSMAEGFTPCYSYSTYGTNPDDWPTGWNTDYNNHSNVACNWTANGYRLPTEMEWMYAAKGGNQSQGYTYAGSNTIGNVAWYYDNSYAMGSGHPDYGTHTVGSKTANELGLYDMSGNIWEWNWDIYGSYPSGTQTNPTGANSGSYRVTRGGGWADCAGGCTVSFRDSYNATSSDSYVGFRCVRVSP